MNEIIVGFIDQLAFGVETALAFIGLVVVAVVAWKWAKG